MEETCEITFRFSSGNTEVQAEDGGVYQMKASVSSAILLLMAIPALVCGQDLLTEHRINGLKGMKEIAFIVRSSQSDEVIRTQDVIDHFTLQTERKLPELKVEKADEAPVWVELSIIVAPHSAFVQISVYRWALIPSVKHQILVKTWDASEAIVEGAITVEILRDTVDTLIDKLALDYVTAN